MIELLTNVLYLPLQGPLAGLCFLAIILSFSLLVLRPKTAGWVFLLLSLSPLLFCAAHVYYRHSTAAANAESARADERKWSLEVHRGGGSVEARPLEAEERENAAQGFEVRMSLVPWSEEILATLLTQAVLLIPVGLYFTRRRQ